MAFNFTIKSDIFNTGVDGSDFALGQKQLTIVPNVVVHSDTFFGVYSNQPGSVLLNKGIILSDSNDGVRFDSGDTGNSVITNAFGGFISGTEGIEWFGAGTKTLNNFGTIVGTDAFGEFVSTAVTKTVVNN